MKKTLLLAAAMVACLGASAQEYAQVDNTIVGALTAGTELAKTDNVSLKVAFDDTYKAQTVNGPKDANDKSYKVIKVNGNTINKDDGGLQGNANPKDIDGGTPASTFKAPASGAVFEFDIANDGYLYVFFKASSNKSYTVFESGSDCLGYKYSQATSKTTILPQVLTYELKNPNSEYNYLDLADFTGTESNGVAYTGIQWPERIWAKNNLSDADYIALFSEQPVNKKDPSKGTKIDWTAIGENGVAVVKFPVYADAEKYYFNANGSKATILGYYYDQTGDATVTLETEDGEPITLLTNGELPATDPTGINGITADKTVNANAPLYNLAGQQVTKAYKGIVLQNGHKFINK